MASDKRPDPTLVAQRYADLWQAIQFDDQARRAPNEEMELIDQVRNALDRKAPNLLPESHSRIANSFLVEAVAIASDQTEILHVRHIDLGSSHGLKTLRQSWCDDIVLTQSLRREAETGLRFRHPNIIETSALLRLEDGRPGLLMPWHPVTLASLPSDQFLDEQEGSMILRSVLLALHAIHQEGLVHCDVTPSNIFLRENHFERSMLGDFGITIPIGTRHKDIGLERAGSPEFAAPEQWRGEQAHPAQDIYALGKLAEKIESRIAERRMIWSELIERCCQTRREDRPQSAWEVLQMIPE